MNRQPTSGLFGPALSEPSNRWNFLELPGIAYVNSCVVGMVGSGGITFRIGGKIDGKSTVNADFDLDVKPYLNPPNLTPPTAALLVGFVWAAYEAPWILIAPGALVVAVVTGLAVDSIFC
jgi:hypothetical protein